MIFLAIKFIYILISSYVIGYGLLQFAKGRIYISRQEWHPSLICLAGISAITAFVSALCLVFRINIEANAIILITVAALVYFHIDAFSGTIRRIVHSLAETSASTRVIIVSVVIFTLFLSVQQTINTDELGYYVPFISWTNRFPVVAGLANLESRIGFNSNWHVYAALFNWPVANGATSSHVNGALYLITFCFLYKRNFAYDLAKLSDVLRVVCLIAMNLPWQLPFSINSPSADLVVIYVTWMLFILAAEHTEKDFGEREPTGAITLILSIFLITIKLSAAPALVFAVYVIAKAAGQHRARLFRLGAIASLVFLLPWFTRTVILTGYLVYPFSSIDVFQFDWKVPKAVVENAADWIKQFAFESLSAKRVSAYHLPFLQKWSAWLVHNNKIYDQLIILVVLSSPVALLLMSLRTKTAAAARRCLELYLLASCGVIFWLLTAPGGRFGYPFTIIVVALVGFPIVNRASGVEWIPKAAWISLFVFGEIAAVGIFFYLKHGFIRRGELYESMPVNKIVFPAPYPKVKTKSFLLDGILPVNLRIEAKAGDAEFPYILSTYDGALHARGNKIQDGFWREK